MLICKEAYCPLGVALISYIFDLIQTDGVLIAYNNFTLRAT